MYLVSRHQVPYIKAALSSVWLDFGGLPYVWSTAVGKHQICIWCSKPYQLCIRCCRIFMGWLTTWQRLAAKASKLCSASMLYAMVPDSQWHMFQMFKSLPAMAQVLWMIPLCISISIAFACPVDSQAIQHTSDCSPAKLSEHFLSCCKVHVCCPHVCCPRVCCPQVCCPHVNFFQASFLCIYCCQCGCASCQFRTV